jgi:acyl CoA:acetate/3-ketoacid CoA transferase beta subunit
VAAARALSEMQPGLFVSLAFWVTNTFRAAEREHEKCISLYNYNHNMVTKGCASINKRDLFAITQKARHTLTILGRDDE